MNDFATLLPTHIPLKWVILLAPLFILLTWHHYQHLFLRGFVHKPSPHAYKEAMKALEWRSGQVAAVWIVALALVVYSDIRYYRMLEEMETLLTPPQADSETAPLEPLDFSAAPPAAAEQGAPNIEEKQREEALDALKFRYEDAFVSYLYLQRCQKADTGDLTTINTALAKSLQALQADPNIQYTIYSAAQGSFEGIYTDIPCEAGNINPVLQQFNAFMQSIR